MFPFHTWLPAAHVQAPSAGSVILAAVLLKMGTYGFLRFCLPLTPAASEYFAPMMIAISIVSILYGGAIALGTNRHQEAGRLLISGAHGLRHVWAYSCSTNAA